MVDWFKDNKSFYKRIFLIHIYKVKTIITWYLTNNLSDIGPQLLKRVFKIIVSTCHGWPNLTILQAMHLPMPPKPFNLHCKAASVVCQQHSGTCALTGHNHHPLSQYFLNLLLCDLGFKYTHYAIHEGASLTAMPGPILSAGSYWSLCYKIQFWSAAIWQIFHFENQKIFSYWLFLYFTKV